MEIQHKVCGRGTYTVSHFFTSCSEKAAKNLITICKRFWVLAMKISFHIFLMYVKNIHATISIHCSEIMTYKNKFC